MEKCPREETFLHLLMGLCLILPLSGLTWLLILSLYHIITKLCPRLLSVCSFAVLALVICSLQQSAVPWVAAAWVTSDEQQHLNWRDGEMLIAAII